MADIWYVNASEIRSKLAEMRQRHSEEAGAIFEMITLLDRLEGAYRKAVAPQEGAQTLSKPRSAQSRRTYSRMVMGDAIYLLESRASGQPAYRVTRQTYELAAKVLAKATEPLGFTDWHRATETAASEGLADYGLRIALRMWLQHHPDLIHKTGTRYQPAKPKTFVRDALKAFDALPDIRDNGHGQSDRSNRPGRRKVKGIQK